MAEDIEEIARRLVVGHKRDGRSIYNPIAKAELIEVCRRGEVSMAKLARECGVNANQLNSWVRQHERAAAKQIEGLVDDVTRVQPSAFVPVQIEANVTPEPACVIGMQARLPNGVTIDLREVDLRKLGEVIETLGRLRCSVSTKG